MFLKAFISFAIAFLLGFIPFVLSRHIVNIPLLNGGVVWYGIVFIGSIIVGYLFRWGSISYPFGLWFGYMIGIYSLAVMTGNQHDVGIAFSIVDYTQASIPPFLGIFLGNIVREIVKEKGRIMTKKELVFFVCGMLLSITAWLIYYYTPYFYSPTQATLPKPGLLNFLSLLFITLEPYDYFFFIASLVAGYILQKRVWIFPSGLLVGLLLINFGNRIYYTVIG